MTQSAASAGPVARAKAEAIRAAGQMARVAVQGELQPAHLIFSIAPSRSHILWLTGHIAFAMDALTAKVAGVAPALPAGYAALFGRGSQPVADPAAYPSFSELLGALGQAVEATAGRALLFRDEEMENKIPEEIPAAKIFPTVSAVLNGVVYHTAYHSGQIAILRRAQGLPSGLGR